LKILVDENIPQMTVKNLKEAGHDVKDIRGTANPAIGTNVSNKNLRVRLHHSLIICVISLTKISIYPFFSIFCLSFYNIVLVVSSWLLFFLNHYGTTFKS